MTSSSSFPLRVWNALATSDTPDHCREDAERSLVQAARSGDRDAFTSLVRLHQQRVFRLCARFYARPEDVEDRAQEVFLTAWRKLHTYQAKAPFEHWLTRVALNCCYQDLRRRPSQQEIGDVDLDALALPTHSPTAGLEVRQLLAMLHPRDRFLLVLVDGLGWTTREAADRLGWTRTNVKVRAHRARARLRRLLDRHGETL